MKTILLPAILTRASSMHDGGLSLGFHTNELTAEEKTTVFEFLGKFGWLAFKENEWKAEELPVTDAEGRDIKTPSQRLRAVIYLVGKQKGVSAAKADDYYRNIMEKLIDGYKKLLVD